MLPLIASTMATLVDELGSGELPVPEAGCTEVVSDGLLEVTVVCASGPMTSDKGLSTGSEMVGSPAGAVGDGIAPRDMPT